MEVVLQAQSGTDILAGPMGAYLRVMAAAHIGQEGQEGQAPLHTSQGTTTRTAESVR